MKHRRLVLSCAVAAFCVPIAGVGMFDFIASAQQPPPLVQPPENIPAAQPAGPVDAPDEVELGHPYESLSAGISFRPPLDCKMRGTISSAYIAEWSDPSRDWTLKLGRMTHAESVPLQTITTNSGKKLEGILDRTVENLKSDLPGSVILLNDVTNTRESGVVDDKHPEYKNNVGLIAIRYSDRGRRRLSQQAIIQTRQGVYYLLTLTTPGSTSPVAGGPRDPGEALAAHVFSQMLDTVRLLDRRGIKEDQDQRLYNTRTAIVNWTTDKLHRTLITQQWLRILKDGKDIGYTYVTEETSGGIPRPLTGAQMQQGKNKQNGPLNGPQDFKKAGDGILIGVRTRLILVSMRSDKTRGPIQNDSASWFFTTVDKKHEDFSRVMVTDDFKAPNKGYLQEFGVSDKRVRRFVVHPRLDPNLPDNQNDPKDAREDPGLPNIADKNGGIIGMRDEWDLDVNETGNFGAAEPLSRKLPPFYIPQALSHLLPRLLPLDRPQKFLFATYVSDAREVVLRYVDVLPEQMVTFNGLRERVIPIRDRIGLEGAPTFHYMTIEGRYLGSENKEQRLLMIPTDAEMLTRIWKDANLTRPGTVDEAGPANARSQQ